MAKATDETLIGIELKRLQKAGQLDPHNTYEFARTNKKSALHRKFKERGVWNPETAQYQYGLVVARSIIKVYAKIELPAVAGPTKVEVSTYVALPNERGEEGSYRPIVDVLDDDMSRDQLLRDTIIRLASIKEVALFTELSSVALAIATAKQKFVDVVKPKPIIAPKVVPELETV